MGGVVSSIVNTVGDVAKDAGDVITGAVDGVGNLVHDVGSSVNNFVKDSIPGGWAGVAAGTLLAVGISDPSLLGLANDGTLTEADLAESGINPSTLSQSIQGLNSDAAAAGFGDVNTYTAATQAGFTNAAQYNAATTLGYTNASDYAAGTLGGFSNAADYTAAQTLGIDSQAGFNAAVQQAGFADPSAFDTAVTHGFTDAQTYADATNLGYTNATDYAAGASQGYANAADYNLGSQAGFQNAAQWQSAGAAGYSNFDDFQAAANKLGFSNINNFQDAIDAGFNGVSASDYNTALGAGLSTYGKYAAAVAAGLIIPDLIQPLQQPTGSTYAGAAPYTWGTAQAPINPGANPGLMAGQVQDFYNNPQGSLADTYYWGVHNPLQGSQNISQQYNTDVNAPATPYGQAQSAVGGNEYLDIPTFIENTIGSPAYQQMTGAVAPYHSAVMPSAVYPSSYSTTQTQAVNPWIGTTFGGPSASPLTLANPILNTTAPVAPSGATNAGASATA